MYAAVCEWYVIVITGKYLHHFVSHLHNVHVNMFECQNFHTQNHIVLCDIINQLNLEYLLFFLKIFC